MKKIKLLSLILIFASGAATRAEVQGEYTVEVNKAKPSTILTKKINGYDYCSLASLTKSMFPASVCSEDVCEIKQLKAKLKFYPHSFFYTLESANYKKIIQLTRSTILSGSGILLPVGAYVESLINSGIIDATIIDSTIRINNFKPDFKQSDSQLAADDNEANNRQNFNVDISGFKNIPIIRVDGKYVADIKVEKQQDVNMKQIEPESPSKEEPAENTNDEIQAEENPEKIPVNAYQLTKELIRIELKNIKQK